MGLCSGYGFLHAIERGQRIVRRQVILRHHHNTSIGGILQTLINRSTTMGVMGQIFLCSYATSIFFHAK